MNIVKTLYEGKSPEKILKNCCWHFNPNSNPFLKLNHLSKRVSWVENCFFYSRTKATLDSQKEPKPLRLKRQNGRRRLYFRQGLLAMS